MESGNGNIFTGHPAMRICLFSVFVLLIGGQAMGQSDLRDQFENAENDHKIKEYGKSIDTLEVLLNSPETPDYLRLKAQALKARCLVRLGLAEAARTAFMATLELDPSWRPDANLQREDEIQLFEQTLRLYEENQYLVARANCPTTTGPWISTGATVAAMAFFLVAKGNTDDKWATHEGDITPETYDEYESAKTRQDIAGGTAVAASLVSVWFWWKYLGRSDVCKEPVTASRNFDVGITPTGVVVAFKF